MVCNKAKRCRILLAELLLRTEKRIKNNMKKNKCTLDYCPQCEQGKLYKKEMCTNCHGRGVQSGGAGECHYCNGEGFVFVEEKRTCLPTSKTR